MDTPETSHAMPDVASKMRLLTKGTMSEDWYHLMRGNATAVNLHQHIFLLTAHAPREVQ